MWVYGDLEERGRAGGGDGWWDDLACYKAPANIGIAEAMEKCDFTFGMNLDPPESITTTIVAQAIEQLPLAVAE